MGDKLTKKDTIKEIIKCAQDPVYFLCTYARIEHPQEGVVDFKLFDYQKDIINLYTKNPRCILMASRQTGKCLIFNTLAATKSDNGELLKIPIGLLYYNELQKDRKLTLLEKIKIFLYKIIYKLENN